MYWLNDTSGAPVAGMGPPQPIILDTDEAPLAQPSFQLDILFPQPNGVYRRTEKFPIIFATTGLGNLWRIPPRFTWELRAIQTDGSKNTEWTIEETRSGERFMPSSNVTGQLLVNNTLMIDSTSVPKHSNSTRWQLHYSFEHIKSTRDACLIAQTATAFGIPEEGDPASSVEGTFNFTIKDDVAPFVFANELCGQPLGTIGYLGMMNMLPCSIILDPPPPALECRTKLNDTGFAEIHNQLGDGVAGCGFSNSSAPNSTALCRVTTAKGDGVLNHPPMMWISTAILILGISYSFLF